MPSVREESLSKRLSGTGGRRPGYAQSSCLENGSGRPHDLALLASPAGEIKSLSPWRGPNSSSLGRHPPRVAAPALKPSCPVALQKRPAAAPFVSPAQMIFLTHYAPTLDCRSPCQFLVKTAPQRIGEVDDFASPRSFSWQRLMVRLGFDDLAQCRFIVILEFRGIELRTLANVSCSESILALLISPNTVAGSRSSSAYRRV